MAAEKSASSAGKRPPRQTVSAKWIRNRRNHPVHLRFKQEGGDRPYFVELAPRGLGGDVEKIPAKLTQTRQFSEAVHGELVEIITETEYNRIQYPLTGYLHNPDVTLVRDADTVVRTGENIDQAIQRNPRSAVATGAGPRVVEMPGSEPAFKERTDGVTPTAEDMIPAGVDLESRKVVLERHRA